MGDEFLGLGLSQDHVFDAFLHITYALGKTL